MVVPYSPHRMQMSFSSPMEKAHLLNALREVTADMSSLSLHVPDFNDEKSSTFFSAYLHSNEEAVHTSFVSKDFRISPFVFTPSAPQQLSSSASSVPPPSPSKTPNASRNAVSLSFSLPAAGGISAPDVFSAFKAVGEEKGKGKGAWNILFVFDRDGVF